MKTEELINILSRTPVVKAPLSLASALGIILTLSTALTLLALGPRPDFEISAFCKTSILLTVFIVAGLLVRESATPVPEQQSGLKTISGLAAFIVGGSIAIEWIIRPSQEILSSFLLLNFPLCIAAVNIYGAAGVVFLTWMMRFYAPADITKAAMLTGFAAASAGALGYSIHCPLDSPTFIVISYGLPVLTITALARIFVPRFIRW